MPTFDSHNSRFTDNMSGRVIAYAFVDDVSSNFTVRTTDGHEAVLSIKDGRIVCESVNVKLFIKGMAAFGAVGGVS